MTSESIFDLSNDIEFNSLDHPSYCGKVYFIILVDAMNDVIEIDENNHVLTRESYLQCPNGKPGKPLTECLCEFIFKWTLLF